MTTYTIPKDTWSIIGAAPTGKVTFQNQTRGTAWFLAASVLPTGAPQGIQYASMEGENDKLLIDIFPAGGANLYVYTQLGGPVFYSAA